MTRLLDWVCARLPVHTPAEMQREFLRGYRLGVLHARRLEQVQRDHPRRGLRAVDGGEK